MKLHAQLTNTGHEVSLNVGSERAIAEVDGRHYELEVREFPDGVYLLLNGTNVYKCRVERKRESAHGGSTLEVALRGLVHRVTIIDPKRLRSGQSSGAHGHGSAEVISPMPGKVVRVLVEAGAQVEAGAGIIVVEAMKMQNELKSPKAGVVVSINAEAGATVNAGDVLAVIE
jgi:biotin carboxyl carrier protein